MLTRTLPPQGQGGLAAAGADLAQALARAGAEVRVMVPGAAGVLAGVEVQALDAPVGRYSRAWWRASMRTFERLGSDRIDVVLGVSAAANALAARTGPHRPAFVFQAHGTSAGEIASKLRSPRPSASAAIARSLYWGLACDRAYRDYDAVVAVGEAVRRRLGAWPTRRLVGETPVHLIRNGVDPAAFAFDAQARRRLRALLHLPDSAPLAMFVGRLQADKGPMRAFEAFRSTRPRRPDLHLAFVGDGPEHHMLQRAILARGLQGHVHLLGARPRGEVSGWLSAADALVFPTRREEGLPLVVLEALACGLPVFTTPQGAADPELPCDRFPAVDSAALAAALVCLSCNAARTSRLPRTFQLDHAAGAYLALFERLVCGRRQQRSAA